MMVEMRWQIVILIWILSRLISVVSSECASESTNESLGQGHVAFDDFFKDYKVFMDDKILSGTRWIWKKHEENPFLTNITPAQYAFLQILFALSSQQTALVDHLIEFFSNKFEFRTLEMRNAAVLINFPLDTMYNVSVSVVHAAKIGLKLIPYELKDEIFSIINKSDVFIRASEKGNIDVMNLLLKSVQKSDLQLAFYKAWLLENYDVLKIIMRNNVTIELKYIMLGKINKEKILHMAAESHNPEFMKIFIKSGVDVNKMNADGFSPLHRAVQSNDLETAKLLIKHGAEVDSETRSGNTALHIAASNANLDIVDSLLDSGSSVDKRNKFGTTAIMISEKYVITGIIHYIFSEGLVEMDDTYSDLIYLNHLLFRTESENIYKGQVSFDLLSNHSKIVKKIENKGGKLLFNEIKSMILGIVLSHGLNTLSECLFNIGAQLNSEKDETKAIFFNAIQTGNKNLVVLMATEGMSVNTKSNDGITALHVAAASGNLDILQTLVKMGGDINVVTSDGQTLLHAAAHGGDPSVVKYLMDKGLNINVKNNFGLTPLAVAVHANQSGIVKAINDNDLYLVSRSSFGQTELHKAAALGNQGIMASLLDSEADLEASTIDGNTPLLTAADNGRASAVEFLIDRGANIDTRRVSDGNNALHVAAERGHLRVVQVLLEKNFSVNSVNRLGITALHLAAKNNQTEIAKFLLDKGADIDAQEEYNQTPLHYAAGSGSVEMLKLLLSKNCKVNIANIKGYNPMDVAALKCDKNMVNILKKYGGSPNFNIDINCIV